MEISTRAQFDKMTIAGGKVTLQFVLDQGETERVPEPSQMTGRTVLLDVGPEQATIFDVVGGEVVDE